MSTNIHIYAERDIFVLKTKRNDVQTIKFEQVWQTSTIDTRMIMESSDKIQAYKDWVMTRKCSVDREEPVYADDDYFQEREPIGVEIVNEGKDHIHDFEEWLEMCSEYGYDVYFEAW